VYKPLPPGVYPIAVDKYVNININIILIWTHAFISSTCLSSFLLGGRTEILRSGHEEGGRHHARSFGV
jgi:hypothetical protein